ncbi:small-subunit processome, Utp12 [Artemisia annua]|uniref:Small-subunit processome, Utp12 n=1 Tax=Artemisia annua TaxID=35608 RepID=A0A2U1QI57_ARTAN|nr:small-subunit processome, Utp12 [Artemisia annua]
MTSSFTSNGELFAAILPDNTLKVWNTSDGKLLAEWKQDGDSDVQFSCIACSFVGKKRKKETSTCLVALGTDGGEVFAINAKDGEMKWKSSGHHHGRIAALSFANKGRKVCAISTDGTTCELNSESGELQKEFRISKKYTSSSVYLSDDKILAAASSKIRVLSLEDGEELLKFSTDSGPVQHISMLDDKNIIITSGAGDKNLQVWKYGSSSETVTTGPILSMRHPPLAIECKNGDGDILFVLSVSESGIGYVWKVETSSEENIVPTKIKVEAAKSASDLIGSEKTKKRHVSILAANLNPIGGDDQVSVGIVYGSLNSPQFTSVDFASPGEDVNIRVNIQEIGVNDGKDQKDTRGKKRAATDPESENDHGDPMDAVQIDNDSDEPTMGEKLASLNIVNNEDGSLEKQETSPAKPPSADSVHVLLKQALHADDRSLLLDCLFRQNEKVITNSVSLLKPSDVFKLLESLIPMIQSRGAVAACALPWLKSLLLQHASIIMSQEASLIALNSLYQIIESRISTFNPAVQLSSSLDVLYAKTVDGVDEEEGPPEPIIFEDFSDEEGPEEGGDDVMETDEEDNEELEEASNVSDLEGSDGMVDF